MQAQAAQVQAATIQAESIRMAQLAEVEKQQLAAIAMQV